mgnify:CR=1 FL=1
MRHGRARDGGRSVGVAVVLALAALVGILAITWVGWDRGRERDRVTADPPPSRGGAPAADEPGEPSGEQQWVESTLAGLSLEERVGQMFMGYVFGVSGDDRDPAAVAGNRRVYGTDTAAQAVARHGLGGVIYFDLGGAGPDSLPDNIVSPEQTKALSADLQNASRVPLLIAADQEQGIVLRVRDGVTLLPGQMAQGATGRPADARDAARVTGADLLALGINVNFAPDADVNSDPANPVIGERAFGDDPQTVARFTAAAVEGYREVGVASAAKHFPGHGATTVDSHLDLPLISSTREQIEAVDLPPFRAAIEAGVPMVMVGHLSIPALDPDLPASLSPAVVDSLLRRELGFDGVIVTDALNMAAITRHHTPAEAAVLAVRAGVDLLLMPPYLTEAKDAVVAAVRSGELDPARIDASVRRILRVKWQLANEERRPPTPEESAAIAAGIAGRSVTLLDQPACGLLPLRSGTAVEVTGPATASRLLTEALAAQGLQARLARADAPRAAGTVRVALVGNDRPRPADTATVVVSTGTPYKPPTGAGAWLATYSRDPASMQALAAVLTGASPPQGHLPVATRLPSGQPLARGFGLPTLPTC